MKAHRNGFRMHARPSSVPGGMPGDFMMAGFFSLQTKTKYSFIFRRACQKSRSFRSSLGMGMGKFPLVQSRSDFGGGNRHGWWGKSTWQTTPPSYGPTKSYSFNYLFFLGFIDVPPQRRTNKNVAFFHFKRPVVSHKSLKRSKRRYFFWALSQRVSLGFWYTALVG